VDLDRILRRKEVERLCGLSRSSIYAYMSRGEFPRPVKIGRRAVGWPSENIADWLNERQQA